MTSGQNAIVSIWIKEHSTPVVFSVTDLAAATILRAIERWLSFGVWVHRESESESESRYEWYSPHQIRKIEVPAVNYKPSDFEPFVAVAGPSPSPAKALHVEDAIVQPEPVFKRKPGRPKGSGNKPVS